MSEILTPKQVQECSDYYFVSPLARSHETLRAERDRLAAEVERLWALLHSGAWHRRDGRTYLAIRLADGADLSCRATREDAIRAALAEAPTREEGPQPVVVPDVPGPDKVCWKQGPAMHRCTYPRGHKGPHQWEPEEGQ